MISSGFSGGTVISEMDTVIAARVEYLYPIALISSSTSAVLVAPWVLITFSRICFRLLLAYVEIDFQYQLIARNRTVYKAQILRHESR